MKRSGLGRGVRPVMSVIMPVAPGCSPAGAERALRAALGPGETLELLAIEGNHPTRQRNVAASYAQSPILYFLDHDSRVGPETPGLVRRALRKPGVAAAGGPNVGLPSRRLLDRVGEAVLGSWLGSPFVSARYRPQGRESLAGEKSLILCNLAVRRRTFEALRGFDPRLYPNEENEFLNRLRGQGCLAIYLPGAFVGKPRWGSWARFLWENLRYGRGRFEQIWINASSGDAVFVFILAFIAAFLSIVWFYPLLWWLIAFYGLVVGAESVRLAGSGAKAGVNRLVFGVLAPILIISRHVAYLGGMFLGAILGWCKRRVGSATFRFKLKVFSVTRAKMTLIHRKELQIGPVPARVNTRC